MKMNVKNQDIVIIDPVYFVSEENLWEEFAETLDKSLIGCTEAIVDELTDYRQTEIIDKDENIIGEWCSDSGLLGCFLLDEVIACSKDFAEDSDNWADYCVIIRNFTGQIFFEKEQRNIPLDFLGEGMSEDVDILSIKGTGEPSFATKYVPTEMFVE